jgi:hypothetical protein
MRCARLQRLRREAGDPDRELLGFLEATYEAAARLGNWDRTSLECGRGEAGVPRAV